MKSGDTSNDAAHAARTGLLQILAGISQSLTVVTQIVAVRLFGTVAFGTYQSCLAIVEMLSRGGMGGADKAMLRYVAGFRARGDEESIDRAIGGGLRLCWTLAGTLVLLAIAGTRLGHGLLAGPGMPAVLPWMAPAALLTGTTIILVQASLAARVTYANLLVRGLAEPVLLLSAMVAAWGLGGGMRSMGVAHLAAVTATAAIAFAVMGRVFGWRRLRRALRAPRLPGFARFTLPIGAGEMLNAVLQRADVLIVKSYLGAEAAAFYVGAEFLGRVVANVRYAFDSVTAGLLSEALHVGDRARLRYNLSLMTRWVMTATFPIVIVVIGLRHELLGLYGRGFHRAAGALTLLACAQALSGSLGLTAWTLMVAGRSRALLLAQLGGAVLNVGLGLWLVPRLGLLGGAVASLGTVAVLQAALLIMTWVVERVHPFERRQWKPLAAAAITVAAQVWLPLPQVVGGRVAVVVISTLVVYVAALLVLGLPPEDRRVLDKLRARLGLGGRPAGGAPGAPA